MKKPEEAMEILEAYDLTGSLRARRCWRGVITRRWRTGWRRVSGWRRLPGEARGRRW